MLGGFLSGDVSALRGLWDLKVGPFDWQLDLHIKTQGKRSRFHGDAKESGLGIVFGALPMVAERCSRQTHLLVMVPEAEP